VSAPGDGAGRAGPPPGRRPAAGGPPAGGPAAGGKAAQPGGTGDAPAAPAGKLERLNTGGLIYGTIVSAAALTVGSGHGDTGGDIADAMVSTVIIYWLAHVYTATLSGRRAGSGVRLRRRVWAAARHEAPILAGGLPAVAVFVADTLAGVSIQVSVIAALGTAIAVLGVEGYLAGRQAGVRGWRLPVEVATAAIFGAMIALLLVALHT
jgi:hypothetical protein